MTSIATRRPGSSGSRTRPFFAFLNYIDAHAPYLLPEGDHRRFGVRPETSEDLKTLRGWHGANKENVTPHQVQLVSDAYDDCIAYLDVRIGRLLEDLKGRGLLENTVVIVTSDHGEHLGEQRLYGHGCSLYRPELHVPLLVLAPGLPKREGRPVPGQPARTCRRRSPISPA